MTNTNNSLTVGTSFFLGSSNSVIFAEVAKIKRNGDIVIKYNEGGEEFTDTMTLTPITDENDVPCFEQSITEDPYTGICGILWYVQDEVQGE